MSVVLGHGGLLADSRMSGRARAVAWAAVMLGVVVLVLVVRRSSGEGAPLDPAGTGRLGAKALVLLLSEGGADVRVSARPPTSDRRTAILLADTLDQERADATTGWVRDGGTLVVTDPTSQLTQALPIVTSSLAAVAGVEEVGGGCPAIGPLAGIATIRTGGSLVFRRDGRAPGAVGCFPSGKGDWLVATPLGRGTVVALGGCRRLCQLPPEPGRRRRAGHGAAGAGFGHPHPGHVGPGPRRSRHRRPPRRRGLRPLLGSAAGAKVAGIQLLVVFLAVALWRGRRLGRPVVEDPPVESPGSELVAAVGHLYQRGRHRRRAADVLAGQARRAVADRLGLPRGTDARTVAEVAAARTGMPVGEAHAALAPPEPPDDEALVLLARATDDLAAGLAEPPAPTQERP